MLPWGSWQSSTIADETVVFSQINTFVVYATVPHYYKSTEEMHGLKNKVSLVIHLYVVKYFCSQNTTQV